MTRPPTPVTAGCIRAELGRRSTWWYGPDVAAAVRSVGCPHMFCPVYRTTTTPDDYAEQIADWLEAECNRHVVRVRVDR